MTNIPDFLEDGMIVHVAKDLRAKDDYLVYRFFKDRMHESGARALCFQPDVPLFMRFGFPITPHWRTGAQEKGFLAVRGLKCSRTQTPTDYPVHPLVAIFLAGGELNSSYSHLLEKED